MCALGSLAVGAGLLWAFDPRLGRGRRAWLRDKTNHHVREVGTFFRRTGRHMSNKMKGHVAVTRRAVRQWHTSEQPTREYVPAPTSPTSSTEYTPNPTAM